MAALCLSVYGAEEVGGWVEESGVGERTRSSPSCSAAREITGQFGRKSPLSVEDPPPEPPASCPTDGALKSQAEAHWLSGWRGLGGTEKKFCLVFILLVIISLTLSISVPAFPCTNPSRVTTDTKTGIPAVKSDRARCARARHPPLRPRYPQPS